MSAATYDLVNESRTCSVTSLDEPCEPTRITLHEHGHFTEDPRTWEAALEVERSPALPAAGVDTSMALRELADGSAYQRMAGPCWIGISKSAVQLNIFFKLEGALAVLRAAYASDGGPSTGSRAVRDGRAPAMDVLKLLGLLDDQSFDQVFPNGEERELDGVDVPVTLLIGADGAPLGVDVYGAEVAAFLSSLYPDGPRPYVIRAQSRKVSFRLSKLGERRPVRTPAPGSIRPSEAPDGFQCTDG